MKSLRVAVWLVLVVVILLVSSCGERTMNPKQNQDGIRETPQDRMTREEFEALLHFEFGNEITIKEPDQNFQPSFEEVVRAYQREFGNDNPFNLPDSSLGFLSRDKKNDEAISLGSAIRSNYATYVWQWYDRREGDIDYMIVFYLPIHYCPSWLRVYGRTWWGAWADITNYVLFYEQRDTPSGYRLMYLLGGSYKWIIPMRSDCFTVVYP